MNQNDIERWYDQECERANLKGLSKSTPPHQKVLAFAIAFGLPLGLTGCGDVPVQPYQPPAPTEPTAYDECKWERDQGDRDLDCDNPRSTWYSSHGYSSHTSYAKTNTPYYQKQGITLSKSVKSSKVSGSSKGVGSGGKSSGGFFSGG